jgi:hypothetical protein
MMGLLCLFRPCRWQRVVNVIGPALVPTKEDPMCMGDAEYGLYQCAPGARR